MIIDNERLYEDDGLPTSEIHSWAAQKYQKVSYYSSLFSAAMKNKWDCTVFLDLFSGAGKGRVKETGAILPGSPLLALNSNEPYDMCVFCEQEPKYMDALQARVANYFPGSNVAYIPGDTNNSVNQILSALPHFTKTNKGLTLCFVDPCNMGQLKFQTLEAIANALYVDFLVLIPTYMDIHRNPQTYTRPDNDALDKYLGSTEWRAQWAEVCKNGKDFGLFVADQFCKRMQSLGFLYEGLQDLELVRMENDRNQRLYHLAFFSRKPLGLKFWRDTRKNTNPQLSMLD